MNTQGQLDEIRNRIEHELVCPLKDAATHIVFGKGNPCAHIVFIGEAPGKEEDLQGKPFVGRAGQELNTLLNTIGLGLDDIYICNILKYRPPQNRDPTPAEIRAHTPYLVEQLKVISPKIVVTLGNYATKFILGGCTVDGMKNIAGITQVHGTVQSTTCNGLTLRVMPMYHPAAMLYNPGLREIVQKDFVVLGDFIRG